MKKSYLILIVFFCIIFSSCEDDNCKICGWEVEWASGSDIEAQVAGYENYAAMMENQYGSLYDKSEGEYCDDALDEQEAIEDDVEDGKYRWYMDCN